MIHYHYVGSGLIMTHIVVGSTRSNDHLLFATFANTCRFGTSVTACVSRTLGFRKDMTDTLAHIRNPKPRARYQRPKLYVIKQKEIEAAKSQYTGNDVDGIPKSDIHVLASMLTVSTKKGEVLSDFTVHRNYRTLNYMHLLSVHSHNIPSLFPCIGNILQLINCKANDDPNLMALGLATLANICLRKSGRLAIGRDRKIFKSCVEALQLWPKNRFTKYCAISLIRNLSTEPRFNFRFFEQDVAQHIVEVLKKVKRKNREAQTQLAYAICNLATYEGNRRLFNQYQTADILLNLTASAVQNEKFAAVRAASADAIANLSLDNDFGMEMLKHRGASSLFIMATHEEQLMTWKSASCALQNFNAVDEYEKIKIESMGLSYLSRLNQADVLKHMPVLRKAQNDMKEGLQTS